MSLFGGIISGAMSGAGTAGLQQQDTQQKLQGGLYNAEQLAQMNADLDVQKQASLMRLQQEMRLNALSDPRLNGGSQSAQSTPAQPVALTSASIDPVIGNAISDATKNGSASTLPPLPIPTSAYGGGKILPPIPMPTPTGGVTYPVPDAVSGLRQGASTNQASSATPIQPAIWQPSHELQLAAYRADIANPGAGAKILEANAPDATGKMLLAQGIAPGSQEWVAAYKTASIKANGESLRGGNTLVVGGKPVFSAPDASGNQIIYDAQGNPSIQRVVGANDAEAQAAASKLSGTNSQTIAPLDARPVDAQGRSIPISTSAALNNGGRASGAGISPAETSAFKANATAAEDNQKLPQLATTALSTKNTYENALQIVNQLIADNKATGPGVVPQQQLWSKLANAFPGIGITPSDYANNIQSLSKYLNNAQASSEAAAGANRSDSSAELFGKGQANADTLNILPLAKAIKYNLAVNDAIPAKNAFIANTAAQYAASGHPTPDLDAQKSWANIYNPKVFEINRLSPEEQVSTINNMTPADAQKYLIQKAAMKKAGVIP